MEIKPKLIHLPNAITCISVCLGWLAIITIHQDIHLSTILGLLAFAADTLDGHIARKLKLTSKLGRQLDSLADSVIYLMWPALVYYFAFNLQNPLGILIQVIFLSTGLYRLARFNTIGYIKKANIKGYPGLPVVFSHLIIVIVLTFQPLFNIPAFLILSAILFHSYFMVQMFPFPRIKTTYILALLFIGILTVILSEKLS